MSVRITITILFTLLVALVLTVVCLSVYFFSYTLRVNTIQTKLTNKAITIGNLLSESHVFSRELVRKIDSLTFLSYTNKIIQAYDSENNKIYEYKDQPRNFVSVAPELLKQARIKEKVFFRIGEREAVAYNYVNDKLKNVIVAAGEDPEGKQTLKNLLAILVVSYLGGLVIAGFGGYFFSNGLLQPIIKIADDVNHISAQNLSKRINTGTAKDEWNYLSNTLNDLLNRLQESFDMQKRFIANASHELSTPLTSISSQLEVSLQREREAPEYRKVMESVHQDVLHISKLTRTLLEFAKASGTSGGIEIAPVRIDEVLLRLPAEMLKINHICSVSFDFDQFPDEESRLLVYGNEELLFTAIKNIVVNACKYSEQPAIVKLGIDTEAVKISVQDNGQGIPESELPHIFEPFYRVNDYKVKDGFGLGLSMASRIIKIHKGEIKVSSRIGKGSTFTILLPTDNRN
jgi:signal transduction histidine kinase